MNKAKNILVTGAAGFIGAALTIKLLQKGENVIGIDNLNNYYDPKLKEARLLEIKSKTIGYCGKWNFYNFSIENKTKLDEISNKFKEIRSLAIKYKERKDIEIDNLNKELETFKKTIEENNTLYESMLDKTTQSLEKIISNTESLSKIQ